MSGGFQPSRYCNEGTKLWMLYLGDLYCDESFSVRGSAVSTNSNPYPKPIRRRLVVMAQLIEMPGVGLILFETGCGAKVEQDWGGPLQDVFTPTNMTEDTSLPAQIAKTGHDIKDVKHVIIGHLHIDHAGGLNDYFTGTDAKIWVHEEELKNSYWAMATKADYGTYLPHYMSLDLNWQTFNDASLELFPGLHLVHSPGHTPGLVVLMMHLRKEGTFIFSSDHYHVKENYEGTPQGWLTRDHNSWFRSHCRIKRFVEMYDAKICFGHDFDVFETFKKNPQHYE